MSTVTVSRSEVVPRASSIGSEISAQSADDVDARARFPFETFAALQASGLLGALIPPDFGGIGASLSEAGAAVTAISRSCSSSGMILAMHHAQVASLVRHGHTTPLQEFVAEVAREQLLVASATSEVGVGGNVRESICAVTMQEPGFHLDKAASVISYGAYADAVLATARREESSPPSDQVLVVCRPPGLRLEQTGEWRTLGMRGTCSPGFQLHASGSPEMILPVPFGSIAEQTMLPISHILWSCVWLGIASAAVDRARSMVHAEARKNLDIMPRGAPALAELLLSYRQLEALVQDATREFDRLDSSHRDGVPMAFTISMNSLKVAASELVVEIVSKALTLCGMAAYAEGTPFSLGRQLRDAFSAVVMINNSRILADNAHMLVISKG
jgi:acyl-CoA dehydrogenase